MGNKYSNKQIIAIVGGSGSGKTSIANSLPYPRVVTHTTREPRQGEINGKDYYFVEEDEFFKIPKIEYAPYNGNYYGVSEKAIYNALDENDVIVVIVEIEGLRSLQKIFGDIVHFIHITCPAEVQYKRMVERGDSKEDIKERMYNAFYNNEFEAPVDCTLAIDSTQPIELSIQSIVDLVNTHKTRNYDMNIRPSLYIYNRYTDKETNICIGDYIYVQLDCSENRYGKVLDFKDNKTIILQDDKITFDIELEHIKYIRGLAMS